MTDLRELHSRAAEGFDRQVQRIGDHQWHDATPCSEWDVRALVNHLVYENMWAPDLLAGKTVDEVGDRYEGDLLGDDPESTWSSSLKEAKDAFSAADALERTVHLSFGDVPGSEYLAQLTTDLTVHSWDLAKALGTDEELDGELVSYVWDTWTPRGEMVRGSGVFGDEVDVPDDADAQTKLLAFLGRRRDWTP